MGGSIINNGTLEAKGGGLHPGRPTGPRVGKADMGGAGGRIAFESNGTVQMGTYDLSGHKTQSRHQLSYYPSLDGTLGLKEIPEFPISLTRAERLPLTPPLAIGFIRVVTMEMALLKVTTTMEYLQDLHLHLHINELDGQS